MCGIFGVFKDESTLNISDIKPLALHARQRGVDASGMVISNKNSLDIFRADASIDRLLKNVEINVSVENEIFKIPMEGDL